jgi:hypothetical protein
MHSIIDPALALAERPNSTAQDTLRGIIELPLGVIELRRPGLVDALASQQDAPCPPSTCRTAVLAVIPAVEVVRRLRCCERRKHRGTQRLAARQAGAGRGSAAARLAAS